MAVGYTALSSRDMVLDAGMKGKGVIPIHYYGDHMWEFGDKSDPPLLEDVPVPDQVEYEEGVSGCGEPGAKDVQEHPTDTASVQAPCDDVTKMLPDVECLTLDEGEKEKDDDPRVRQVRMDELLEWCFLCAIKMSLKKSDLPILTSNFYRNHMLPCCPPGKILDIKKSSYKKLSKFLNEMNKREILKLKQQKDVESITEVDRNHSDLRGFDTEDVQLTPKARAVTENPEMGEESLTTTPTITEVYLVTTNTLPVFKPLGLAKGCALTAPEVRNLLKQYSQVEQLEGPQSRGYVTLDPILAQVLLNKGEYAEVLRHDELTSRCLAKMTLAHRMELNGQPSVIKKGHLQPVSIKVVTRSGNKKATLVDNLEVYGIDCQELAHAVQKGMACSTTVTPLPGKNSGLQVMVQGNQTAFITNLLTDKYQLKLKWITGAEKAGKGKKR